MKKVSLLAVASLIAIACSSSSEPTAANAVPSSANQLATALTTASLSSDGAVARPTIDAEYALVQLKGDPLSTYAKTKPPQGKKIDFNANTVNQLRLATSARHDSYEIPNTPETEAAGRHDGERETDAFVNVSWVRTFKSGTLLTASPFYHYNAADFEGGSNEELLSTDEQMGRD